MRKLFALGVVALALAAATVATPAQAQYSQWVCRAESPYAWGEGWSPYESQARYNALLQCAVNTPSNYNCVIRWCVQR